MIRILWIAPVSYFPCNINYALIPLSSLGHRTPHILAKGAQHPNAPNDDVTSVNRCHLNQLFIICHTWCSLLLSSGLLPAKPLFGGQMDFLWESECLRLRACSGLGTQKQPPQLAASPGAEQGSAPCMSPQCLQGFHPSTSPLRCRPVCEQKHGASVWMRRFHFPGAARSHPCSQAQFFRLFTRLWLAWCVMMLKKPRSSMSRRGNETDFPVDLFLLLEQLF